ncbi:unnamed protein product, partial [Thlaspi arvense]
SIEVIFSRLLALNSFLPFPMATKRSFRAISVAASSQMKRCKNRKSIEVIFSRLLALNSLLPFPMATKRSFRAISVAASSQMKRCKNQKSIEVIFSRLLALNSFLPFPMATKRSFRAISVAASSQMKRCKNRKLTEKIRKEAYAQEREVEDEENAQKIPMSASFKQAVYGVEDSTDDADELSEEFQSELDYQNLAISETEEEKLLLDALFHKDGASIAKCLSNAITTSFKDLEDKIDVSTRSACASETDFYRKLGKFMSLYTRGKMPKALDHLSEPENWSPDAMYKATNMFASTSKAGRFYELFLLPRVREDIRNHKKLHFRLYQSLKKTLFKPRGFYCGIIIPLCKEFLPSGTCTLTEAVIRA